MTSAPAVRKIPLIGYIGYKAVKLFSTLNRSAGLKSVRGILFFVLMVALPFYGQAQYRLLASHETKSIRNHIFNIGEEMRFKTYNDNIYFKGIIEGIEDSLIHFESFKVPLSQIKKIDLSGLASGRFNFQNYYTYLPLGAMLFVGADLVNNPGFNVSPGIAIAAGAMVGAAIIFYCLHRRVANRDKGWSFSVLDF